MEQNVYQRNGFENRRAYLESLAQEYNREAVYALSDVLGPNEDFDGLISELEDAAECGLFEEY